MWENVAGRGSNVQRSRGEREQACPGSETERHSEWLEQKMRETLQEECGWWPRIIHILLFPPGSSWLGRWQSRFLILECFTVCKMLPCLLFTSFHVSHDAWQSWDSENGWGQSLCDVKWLVQGHTAKGSGLACWSDWVWYSLTTRLI